MVKGRGKTARVAASSKAAPRFNTGVSNAANGTVAHVSAAQQRNAAGEIVPQDGADVFPFPPGVSPSKEFQKPLRSRAQYESLLARCGTPAELQERIETLLRDNGMDEKRIRAFRRMHSPEAFAAGVVHALGRDRVEEEHPGSHEALEEASVILGRHTGRAGDAVLQWHLRYAQKVDAACAAPALRRLGHISGISAHTLREYAGWSDGRPVSLERLAKRQGVPEKKVRQRLNAAVKDTGYSPEEVARVFAHVNGRRYFWPEEVAKMKEPGK